jgi:hypothetical protein
LGETEVFSEESIEGVWGNLCEELDGGGGGLGGGEDGFWGVWDGVGGWNFRWLVVVVGVGVDLVVDKLI